MIPKDLFIEILVFLNRKFIFFYIIVFSHTYMRYKHVLSDVK